jgi:hypothetical protein
MMGGSLQGAGEIQNEGGEFVPIAGGALYQWVPSKGLIQGGSLEAGKRKAKKSKRSKSKKARKSKSKSRKSRRVRA